MPSPPPPAPPVSGAVSMRDVAAAAGVARMTVSRAFRPGSSMRPEVRARVLAAAERLGYRPDPLVSGLMTSFARRRPVRYRETLAALWWPVRWRMRAKADGFAQNLFAGIEAAGAKHGCRVDHFVLGKTPAAALARTLAARNIRGMILTPPTAPLAPAPRLDWTGFSVIAIGSSLREPAFDRVHQDHYGACVRLLRRLRERGCGRPVLVVNAELEERMLRAYTGAFLAHEAGPAGRVLRMRTFDPGELARRMAGLRPDVIVVDSETWLPVIRRLPGNAGRRGVVSLDVSLRSGPVSGVFQNPRRMAECAIDLLMQARLRHETGVPAEPMTVLTPGVWVEGETAPWIAKPV